MTVMRAHFRDRYENLATLAALAIVLAAILLMPGRASAQTFDDVPTTYWAFDFIEAMAAAGITSGCGGGDFCPENRVTRAQMAIFLERGMNGGSFSPPAATGTMFSDVSVDSFAAAWIEKLANDGITSGCGGGNYCPNADVSRAQMAVFLLRAAHGSSYSPPAATGSMFLDVPSDYWAVQWIEQLAVEGITSSCGDNNYCPNDPVTRAQMSVFLTRIFSLDSEPPAVVGVTPSDGQTEVPVEQVISIEFSQDIDADTFNATNVTVVGPDGDVSGTFGASGTTGTFTPDSPLTHISRFSVSISMGVLGDSGLPLAAPFVGNFFTAVNDRGWYLLSNEWLGSGNKLTISESGSCWMDTINDRVGDVWQFKPVAPGATVYTMENVRGGDRAPLGPNETNTICQLGSYPGGQHTPSADQTWEISPIQPSVENPALFRLISSVGALTSSLLRSVRESDDQFWTLTPFDWVMAFDHIGESAGGGLFFHECQSPNRVVGVDLSTHAETNADIDLITTRCIRPDGTTFTAGSSGGTSGGTPVALDCPVGSIFAGLRGTSHVGWVVDQLGIMCRWPFSPPVPWGDLQGLDSAGGDIVESVCVGPWQATAIRGRAGALIDRVHTGCELPERTFSETDPVGGGGGSAFKLGCTAGQAANGLRGFAGDDIEQIGLGCVDSTTAQVADSETAGAGSTGTDLADTQLCFAGEVMVGVKAKAYVSPQGHHVIDQITVRCTSPGSEIFDFGQGGDYAGADGGGGSFETFDCPAGMFVSGLTGRIGALLDNVALQCSWL